MAHPLVRRCAGWLGADGNPLRRRMDRFEAAARVLLVAAFLVAVPLLVPAAGRDVYMAAMRQVRQQQSWREVNAVLLQSAPRQILGFGSMSTYWLPARWRAPDGAARTGDVPARTGTLSGQAVPVWVDWSGRQTGHQPMTAGLARIRMALAEFGTVVGIGLTLLALAGLLAMAMNRRRMTYWAMEWASFGPRWTTRRWPGN